MDNVDVISPVERLQAPTVREALHASIDEASSGQQLHTAYQHDDWTLLQYAASTGDLTAVQLILSKGVDPDGIGVKQISVTPQMTPLHIAARCNHVDIMKALAAKCNINSKDQWGFTPLHYAVASRLVKYLFPCFCINSLTFTISLYRQKEAVICLLEYGSAASTESNNKSTPLDIAKSLGFEEISDILASKASRDQDPSVPKFRDWLHYLGAVRLNILSLSRSYTHSLPLSFSFLSPLSMQCLSVSHLLS